MAPENHRVILCPTRLGPCQHHPMTAPEPPDALLLFTPVPTAYRGANGWTAEVQRAFVAALARTGVVTAAARSVGRSARSAYLLRRRAGENHPFVRAWEAAQARAGGRALDLAMAAGLEPRRTEVFYRGRQVGWRTSWDNRLAFAALRALDRQEERWARAGLDATKLLHDVTKLPNGCER